MEDMVEFALNSNDVRRGNIVQDEHGSYCFIYRIWKDGVEVSSDMDGHDDIDLDNGDFYGIPITEELLLKFGFEKKDKGYFKDDFFCYLVYGGGSGWKTWVNMVKDDFTLALVGQVHQLQNLYFALAGEELTITNNNE